MGSSFECVWVAQEFTLVESFFRFRGYDAIVLGIGVDWTLAILFFFCVCNKGLHSTKLLLFAYILISRKRVDWISTIFSNRF